jgi:tetratricopeptide (TPR) repeat protein
VAAIREALDVTHTAHDLIPPGHWVQAMNLAALGTLLIQQHEVDSDRAVLDESVRVLRAAADLGGTDAPRAMSMLSVAYLTRYRLDGALEDLDESVALGRRALAAAADDPALPDWLGNLGNALRLRFLRLGDLADADAAVEVSRRALELTPVGHADRARASHTLGSVLLDRYKRTSDAADLDGGVAAMREAAARIVPGTLGAALVRSTLGRALTDRYERYGVTADLDEAVAEIRTALNSIGTAALVRPGVLNNLAAALHIRANLTGSSTDIDDAISASREALRLSAPGSDTATTAYLNLGYFLTSRYVIASQREDIDEAVTVLRTAVSRVGADQRPSLQLNLANALAVRYRYFQDPADLDDSITAVRAAGDDPGAGPLRRLRYHAMLGYWLTTRFSRTGAREDVEEAVAFLRNVVANTASDEPERALRLYLLGTALLRRGHPLDRAEAFQAAREATTSQAAPSSIRMEAAQRWATMAVQDGDPVTALEGYERAIELLPLLAWRALSRADQERQLTDVSGVSCDAAAVAIRVSRPKHAVELLEQGRTVLWSQVLDSRDDLAALRDVRPQLADRLYEVRTALGRAAPCPASLTSTECPWRGSGTGCSSRREPCRASSTSYAPASLRRSARPRPPDRSSSSTSASLAATPSSSGRARSRSFRSRSSPPGRSSTSSMRSTRHSGTDLPASTRSSGTTNSLRGCWNGCGHAPSGRCLTGSATSVAQDGCGGARPDTRRCCRCTRRPTREPVSPRSTEWCPHTRRRSAPS